LSAIRPPLPNALPASPQGVTPQPRSAAQKAFFEAALGRAAPAQGPAQTQVPAKTTEAAAAIQPHATSVRDVPLQVRPGDEPPQKILRPGSLLDIRV